MKTILITFATFAAGISLLAFGVQPAFSQIVENDAQLDLRIDAYYAASDGARQTFYVLHKPNEVVVVLENRGNVSVWPNAGTVTIKNVFNEIIARRPFNEATRSKPGSIVEEQAMIAPDETHRFTVNIDSSELIFGPYTAELSFQYNENFQPSSAVIKFWILPWNILLAGALGLSLLVYILVRLRRFYHARLLKRHGLHEETGQ